MRAVARALVALLLPTCGDPVADPTFVNRGPRFVNVPSSRVEHDREYLYRVMPAGDDGDPVVVAASRTPTWLTFDSANRALHGTARADNVGRRATRPKGTTAPCTGNSWPTSWCTSSSTF